MMRILIMIIILSLLLSACTPIVSAPVQNANAQSGPRPPTREIAYWLDSGLHSNSDSVAESIVFSHTITIDNADWLRLHFQDFNLGTGSYIILQSLKDNDYQHLDAVSLPEWSNASAFFNGDSVRLELHVAPSDNGIFVQVDQLTIGERITSGVTAQSPQQPTSLCGADNRASSTDKRVGRLQIPPGGGTCTAWLVSNGAVLTAGHCADFDPDEDGPLLPDGVRDLQGVMEFNVPASDPDGSTNWAAVADQYPIITNTVVWHFDGVGQGLGKDWTVFGLKPNSNTGKQAHIAQGFFRMTNANPTISNTIRVTGFGTDNTPAGTGPNDENADNFTNQTATGPYISEIAAGTDIRHTYRVDTTGGNSGSPIIWTTQNETLTVGIHTNAGCLADGSGANSGTSFEVNVLETAIQNFPGPKVVYVDIGRYTAVTETGTIFLPFDTVAEGVLLATTGITLSIVTGSYDEAITITKALTLTAPVGTVTIGQ